MNLNRQEVNADLIVYGYLPFYGAEKQIGQTPTRHAATSDSNEC